MDGTVLYVEKDTDLMRATLMAFGLAAWFHALIPSGSGAAITLHDLGGLYAVKADVAREVLIERARRDGFLPPLIPAIHKPPTANEQKQLEAGESPETIRARYVPASFPGAVVDYGAEKGKADAETQARRAKTREEGDVAVRHPDFPLWAHLCSYFGKGSAMRIAYPLVVHAWSAHRGDAAVALAELILDYYGNSPSDSEGALGHWVERIKPMLDHPALELFDWMKREATVSAVSIVSPTTAQGSYTDSGARGVNTGTPDIFWLDLYLAFAGYMTVGMPYRIGSDVVLYYPLPRQIGYDQVRDIMTTYRDSGAARHLYDISGVLPRAKADALSQIIFYQEMVEHHRKQANRRRINAIDALVGYFYKDISAQIPFDETTFALPGWLPLQADAEQLLQAKEVLEQHKKIIEAVRGEYAEELAILGHYRRFITLGDPDDWVAFAISYSQHRFSKLPDAPWMPFLASSVFEITLHNAHQEITTMQDKKDYRPILDTPGFQHIANAINACTVYLRYIKDVKKQSTAFKVRHGLGDDLRRNAHNPDQFIADLSDFIHDYSQESASVQANTGESRSFVTQDDLYEVVALINIYGSRVVANLLVAAGYASRFERKSDDQQQVEGVTHSA
jgi:hypothetical protein